MILDASNWPPRPLNVSVCVECHQGSRRSVCQHRSGESKLRVPCNVGRCLGSLLIDEVCDAAKAVSNSNLNAALFCLQPQPHSAIEKTSILAKRRSLEDKLMGFLKLHFC